MSKTILWKYNEIETDAETGYETGNTIEHNISLKYSYLSGKAIVTIDGNKFDISERPFALKGTEQIFRLGESAAMLKFEKGTPTVTVDNVILQPERN